jgi:predicted nucleic acid-binding protein
LHVLWEDPDHTWHITPVVRGEILSEPTRSEVSRAVLNGNLVRTELDMESNVELTALARWSTVVDPGEAVAIALAASRGWVVGIEDLFAQRRLTEEVGAQGWLNAAGLLVAAVHRDRITLSDAGAILRRLDSYPGYEKRGVSELWKLMGPAPDPK